MNTSNNWDWRIYCGNKGCNFKVELKLSELQNYFNTKFNKEINESNKEHKDLLKKTTRIKL